MAKLNVYLLTIRARPAPCECILRRPIHCHPERHPEPRLRGEGK
jgi:hypothetical protein